MDDDESTEKDVKPLELPNSDNIKWNPFTTSISYTLAGLRPRFPNRFRGGFAASSETPLKERNFEEYKAKGYQGIRVIGENPNNDKRSSEDNTISQGEL